MSYCLNREKTQILAFRYDFLRDLLDGGHGARASDGLSSMSRKENLSLLVLKFGMLSSFITNSLYINGHRHAHPRSQNGKHPSLRWPQTATSRPLPSLEVASFLPHRQCRSFTRNKTCCPTPQWTFQARTVDVQLDYYEFHHILLADWQLLLVRLRSGEPTMGDT
jgi:hypothetical protein